MKFRLVNWRGLSDENRFTMLPKDLFKYTTNVLELGLDQSWLGSAPDVYSLSQVSGSCPVPGSCVGPYAPAYCRRPVAPVPGL